MHVVAGMVVQEAKNLECIFKSVTLYYRTSLLHWKTCPFSSCSKFSGSNCALSMKLCLKPFHFLEIGYGRVKGELKKYNNLIHFYVTVTLIRSFGDRTK